MKFKDAIVSCFTKYATFAGRASRSEYWKWVLFNALVGFVAGLIDGTAFHGNQVEPVGMITSLALMLPSIAVAARRLHDVDRSGWWMLIAFTIIGIIPLVYWYCKKGTDGDNRFGPDPLEAVPQIPNHPYGGTGPIKS